MEQLNYFYSTEGIYTFANGVKGERTWTVDSSGTYKFTDAHYQDVEKGKLDAE